MILRPHYNIYIASCAEDGGIYHYQTDEKGNVSLLKKYNLDRPMYMIVSGDKMHCLLRAPFGKTSGLISFKIESNGSLTQITTVRSTKGMVACHLAEVDENIYCVNYLSGSVLRMPDTLAVHRGYSIAPKRQEAPHPHYVCASPDDRYIFVTDLGLDKIFIYNKDLTLHSVTDMPAGHGPRHLVCHPDGKTVYCANELQSTVSVLEYREGMLTVKDTVSTLPPDYAGKSTVAAIRYANHKIYVTNRGHNSIPVFNENMVVEKWIPSGGDEPRDIWILDDVVICTNQFSNKVCFIRVVDGAIIHEIDMEAPLCVLCTSSIEK